MPEKERWANSIIMINLRKILAASSLALGIGATAAPTTAQYYYYVPSQNYEQGYGYPETYTTPVQRGLQRRTHAETLRIEVFDSWRTAASYGSRAAA
jgi:hypothetical protein